MTTCSCRQGYHSIVQHDHLQLQAGLSQADLLSLPVLQQPFKQQLVGVHSTPFSADWLATQQAVVAADWLLRDQRI
jgi:hypothetical protein